MHFVERHNTPWDYVAVDEIGVGAGVVDLLIEQEHCVRSVNFASAAEESGRFANLRAESFWHVREALTPDAEEPLSIPGGFGRLCAELATLEWSVTSTGKILLEPKEKIKKRIGRSPDHADALALSYAAVGPMILLDVI